MVRFAEKRDIPEIMKLLEQVLLVHHQGRPDLFNEKGTKYQAEEIEEMLSDKEKVIFVYEDQEGKILGHCFCCYKDHPKSSICPGYISFFINDLCVEENARGKHVGTELYEAAKKLAAEKKCYNLCLNVWECNPTAMAFYRAKGLVPQSHIMEQIL